MRTNHNFALRIKFTEASKILDDYDFLQYKKRATLIKPDFIDDVRC